LPAGVARFWQIRARQALDPNQPVDKEGVFEVEPVVGSGEYYLIPQVRDAVGVPQGDLRAAGPDPLHGLRPHCAEDADHQIAFPFRGPIDEPTLRQHIQMLGLGQVAVDGRIHVTLAGAPPRRAEGDSLDTHVRQAVENVVGERVGTERADYSYAHPMILAAHHPLRDGDDALLAPATVRSGCYR